MTQDSILFIIGSGMVSTLAGVVVYQQHRNERNQEKYQTETRKDLEECRTDREKLWAKLSEVQTELGRLSRG